MKNIAVILAAGTGNRFCSEVPKQYVQVQEKMIIEYTIEAFQKHAMIDEIIVAVQPQYVSRMEELKEERGYEKLSQILVGGEERYATTLAILNHLADEEECNLLLHDAVRPFIDQETISNVISALEENEAVVVAVPSIDTVLEITPTKQIMAIPDRRKIWRAQTPQAFRRSVLQQAFEKALRDPAFSATDDSGVVFRYLPEVPIYIVEGNPANIKITYKEDLAIIERTYSQ